MILTRAPRSCPYFALFALAAVVLGTSETDANCLVVRHGVTASWWTSARPSGKFGANAAWFRITVLTYNLLTALKGLTLPRDFSTARPKRLRFLLFNTVGKVVHQHGGPFCG